MSRRSFVGKDVTISFDSDVCQHSGNCVNGLAAVFDTEKRPWINPDGASRDAVIAQVAQCPSGALRIEPAS
jgi:uncharacterized Fe-S cluster protein YjdI